MYFEVLQQHFRNAGGFGVVVALAGVQPALSRSMQRLETALQVSLFDRQKSKIELNDNGRMAVEYAGRIVGEARDMAARIQAFDRSRRTILVGSCAPAPLWEISQVLADLYPDRTIASEMRENQVLLEGLRDGVYQLIILPHPVEEAGVTCAKYGEEHLFFSLPRIPVFWSRRTWPLTSLCSFRLCPALQRTSRSGGKEAPKTASTSRFWTKRQT